MIAEPNIQTQTTHDRKLLIGQLYKSTFPLVAAFVRKKGGSLQDAKDVFHDALVVYLEKAQENRVPAEVQPQSYLSGIAKHLWFRKFNSEPLKTDLDDTIAAMATEDETAKLHNSLIQLLERTGKKCLGLLKAFYYDRQNMQQVSEQLGYSSVRSATVQKFKCMEKIREEVKERKLFYEDFA